MSSVRGGGWSHPGLPPPPAGFGAIIMSGLRIDVADLLAHPGARRDVVLEQPLEALAGTSARIEAPVRIQLLLERIPDGIVARGTVVTSWSAECSTCLRDLERVIEVHVDELFERDPVEGETYPIEGEEIDVEQLARDALLLELPLAPHCDTPCAPAVVPEGVVISDADATSSTPEPDEPRDPRWAALAELEL